MFPANTKILVVDDMMTMRKIVTKGLKDLGYSDIKEAADGNLAWAELDQANPPFQLIVSDWNMPNCSGLDFLRKLRADARFKTIPFIMLTAEAEAHQVKEAIMAGVTNYITKPFTGETLKQKIEQTFKKVAA